MMGIRADEPVISWARFRNLAFSFGFKVMESGPS